MNTGALVRVLAATSSIAFAHRSFAQTQGFPVEFHNGPSAAGQGAVQGFFLNQNYSNQYLNFTIQNFSYNPGTLQAQIQGSGNTGGGIGSGSGDASIFTQTSLISALTINGAAHSNGNAPGINTGTYGQATAIMQFDVTSPINARWTSTGESTLLLGGIPFGGASEWVLLLPAGHYEARAYAHGAMSSTTGSSFFSSAATFKLEIGVPAPSSAAILGIAGLATARRRR